MWVQCFRQAQANESKEKSAASKRQIHSRSKADSSVTKETSHSMTVSEERERYWKTENVPIDFTLDAALRHVESLEDGSVFQGRYGKTKGKRKNARGSQSTTESRVKFVALASVCIPAPDIVSVV